MYIVSVRSCIEIVLCKGPYSQNRDITKMNLYLPICSTFSIQTAIPSRIQGAKNTRKSTLSSVSSGSLHFLKQVALNPIRPSTQSAVTMGTSEKRKIVFATVSGQEDHDVDMPTARPPSQHSTTPSEAENSRKGEEHFRSLEAIAWLVT